MKKLYFLRFILSFILADQLEFVFYAVIVKEAKADVPAAQKHRRRHASLARQRANKKVESNEADTSRSRNQGRSTMAPKKERSDSIDFDEEFVEGVNKRPLDSLNQISESGRGKKSFHIYDKKNDFIVENFEALRYLRYTK